VLSSRIFTFADPHPYQAAIRAAHLEIFPTTKGNFRAELMQIDLHKLWLQRGRENLARVSHGAVIAERAAIGFLIGADQPAIRYCGIEVSPGEIMFNKWSSRHRRSFAPCHWGGMSLTPADLAAAGRAIAGRELTVPTDTYVVRPVAALMARLLALHEEAAQLAKTAPHKLAHPEVARSLEQALVHTMVRCLTEGTPIEIGSGTGRHSAVIARLEEFLATNHDRPLYLAEICAATSASERTLRVCCQEHLGMGPVRYLWLRRMHLARHALVLADPATATVTDIATEYGFWELGRFSVEYRALFRESPSASLRRPPERVTRNRPLGLPSFRSLH
jgi:AraC-like DNA-binding protein